MNCPFCEVKMEREEGFEKKSTSYGFRLINAVYYYCEECGAEFVKLTNKPLRILWNPNSNFDEYDMVQSFVMQVSGDEMEDIGDEIIAQQVVSIEKCASFYV